MEVDILDDYAFCESAPEGVSKKYDLVFHNPLLCDQHIVLRARIVSIQHPTLGALQSVQTAGLVYLLTLTDGTSIQVEAEETPGKIEHASTGAVDPVKGWDLDVVLSQVP